jgi:GNAT superfamily N-acetyltransferase
MEVRPARPGDERRIAEVHVCTWQAAYRGQMPDAFLDGLSVERRASAWLRILTESTPPATGAFVLTDQSEVLGFAHVAPSRDPDRTERVGELTAIYVAPEFWGSGGGDLLLARAVAALREADFWEATLWVLEGNLRAQRFYESNGWSPDLMTKVDQREGFELREVRYRCDLRGGERAAHAGPG